MPCRRTWTILVDVDRLHALMASPVDLYAASLPAAVGPRQVSGRAALGLRAKLAEMRDALRASTEGGLWMPHEWYEIRVEGHLPSGWSYWFEGLDIQRDPGGDSIVSGPLPDQAALHGVLAKIRDLNLKLISVSLRSQEQATREH